LRQIHLGESCKFCDNAFYFVLKRNLEIDCDFAVLAFTSIHATTMQASTSSSSAEALPTPTHPLPSIALMESDAQIEYIPDSGVVRRLAEGPGAVLAVTNPTCPWGPGNHDLKGRVLSRDQKVWIGNQIVEGGLTIREVATRFNLSQAGVHRYAQSIRKKQQLRDGVGRTPLLEDEDKEVLRAIVRNAQIVEIMQKDFLAKEIQQLARERHAKRNERIPSKAGSQLLPVSAKTLRRIRDEVLSTSKSTTDIFADLASGTPAGPITKRARRSFLRFESEDFDPKTLAPCPWGPGKTDLKGRKLSYEEKSWLGQLVNDGGYTLKMASDRFCLSKTTLQTFASKVRTNKYMGTTGHPSIIEPKDIETLRDIVMKSGAHLQDTEFLTGEYLSVFIELTCTWKHNACDSFAYYIHWVHEMKMTTILNFIFLPYQRITNGQRRSSN
jgi:transposase